jgi:hypothetical protein
MPVNSLVEWATTATSAGVKGPTPVPAFSHNPGLHLRNLGLVAYSKHTLRTTNGGCIPNFTNIGAHCPLISLVMARISTQEAKWPWLMATSPEEYPAVATSS